MKNNTETMQYLRVWTTDIAERRQNFIGCLVASLRGGEITLEDAVYAMGYAGLELTPSVRERFQNVAVIGGKP